MSTDDSRFATDSMVSSYIERLMALSRERGTRLGTEELREVARDLGLSDADLARAEAAAEEHLTRGRNFLEHGAFAEAISELGQVAALRPLDAGILCLLGRAHIGRFQAGRDQDDRAQAEVLARRAIELDAAYKPAYELLAMARGTAGQRRTAKRSTWGLAVAGGLVAAVAGAGYLFFGASSSAPVSSVVVSPGSAAAPVVPAMGIPATPAIPDEQEIPLALVADDKSRGLSLTVERSQLRRFSGQGSFSYYLDATLTVAPGDGAAGPGFELHKARARLELLDASGQLLRQNYVDLRAEYLPYLRPGDATAVHALLYEQTEAPPLHSGRLIVETVDKRPAAVRYDEGELVEVVWPGGQPAHIDIEVRVRESEVNTLLSKHSHWLSLSVRNRGTRSIEGLKLAITRYGADGTEIATGLIYAVLSTGPALPAGQTWVIRDITELPDGHKPLARFTVTAIEAE